MGVAVFGHQGGWDEILVVALPIVLFVLLLRVANSRAAHLDEQVKIETTPNEAGAPDPGREGHS